MNYDDLRSNSLELLLVDEQQAGAMCGKVSVFKEICDAYKVKPVVDRRSCKLYSTEHIKKAVARLIQERR